MRPIFAERICQKLAGSAIVYPHRLPRVEGTTRTCSGNLVFGVCVVILVVAWLDAAPLLNSFQRVLVELCYLEACLLITELKLCAWYVTPVQKGLQTLVVPCTTRFTPGACRRPPLQHTPSAARGGACGSSA